jgi:hypothetical protein
VVFELANDDEVPPVAMESPEDRLKRFQNGSPTEIWSTLTNSINNFFNPEIDKAAEAGCWSLVIIGIHGVALTLSEGLFGGNSPEKGYVRFLKTFMDRDTPGDDFSVIGAELHRWRNILAHQWLATAGHSFGLDTNMALGWERREGVTVLNPARYHAAYKDAFRTSSPLWRPDRILGADEMQVAKRRLIGKYRGR